MACTKKLKTCFGKVIFAFLVMLLVFYPTNAFAYVGWGEHGDISGQEQHYVCASDLMLFTAQNGVLVSVDSLNFSDFCFETYEYIVLYLGHDTITEDNVRATKIVGQLTLSAPNINKFRVIILNLSSTVTIVGIVFKYAMHGTAMPVSHSDIFVGDLAPLQSRTEERHYYGWNTLLFAVTCATPNVYWGAGSRFNNPHNS